MSELNIRGSVRYGPGPWGLSAPVAGAKLTLRQTSVGSSDPRTIWEGTADSRGEFSERTQEWRRTIKIKVGFLEHDGPDPSDLLALSMRIELNGQSVVRPFVYVADFVSSPPLFASWIPANAVVARINGRDCYTVAEVARQCVELMRTPSAADIEVAADSLLTGVSNQEWQLNDLIAWWFTELRTRLREARQDQTAASTVKQLAVQQQARQAQAKIGVMRQSANTQLATSVLATTLQIICTVVGVVPTVFTVTAASLAIVAAVIAMVIAVGTVGFFSSPVVRTVTQIALRVSGRSLNLIADATATIVSIVLLTVLAFILAGWQGFEWARTTVLGGRRGWKFRLS